MHLARKVVRARRAPRHPVAPRRADVSEQQGSAQRTESRARPTPVSPRRTCASCRTRRRRRASTRRAVSTFANSDLAFRDKYVYQGNFAGFTIWDVSDPAKPKVVSTVQCVTSQGDPSIYGNLLFLSAEGGGNRNDCAKGGVQDPKDHMAGVRIYDVSDPAQAASREERADVQGVAHAHDSPAPEGQGRHLHLRLGQPGSAPGHRSSGVQGRNGPGGRDELALPARRHQGAARRIRRRPRS